MNTPDFNPPLPQEGEPSSEVGAPHAGSRIAFSEYPADLQSPWSWRDLFVLLAVSAGCYILLSFVLVLFFYFHGVSLDTLQKPGAARSLFVVLNTLTLSAGVMGFLFISIRFHFRQPFWRTLGWRPFDPGLPRGVVSAALALGGTLFAIIIGLASNAIGKNSRLPIETYFQDRQSALLLMAMGILVAPLVEETIFRGYLYPLLARSFGIPAGVLVTGALFGLLHAEQLWGGWGQIALLILVGIVFTYVRALAHTVLASYILHLSYNTYLFTAFYVSTGGFRHLPFSPS
jgi:membrane protease YdiL (CAAX protease family)